MFLFRQRHGEINQKRVSLVIETMIEKLELFVEIANQNSISGAANATHTSQSVVSHVLKTLESQMGILLFDRIGRNICINDNGKRFLEFSTTTLAQYAVLKKSLEREDTRQRRGVLTVSAGNYFNAYYFPMVLPLFMKEHSGVQIETFTQFSDQLIQEVEDNAYEFAIVATSSTLRSPHLQTDFSFEIPLYFICSPNNLLAGAGIFRPADANGQTFIFPARGSNYRDYLEYKFTKHRFHFSGELTIDSPGAVKCAVMEDLGVSILPQHVVQRELDEKKLVHLPIERIKLRQKMVCIHNVDNPPSAIARDFINMTVEVLNRQEKIKNDWLERRKKP